MATSRDHGGDGTTPRRTRMPSAERRETILRAATGVFAEAGYRAAKVSEVATRVGVTEPVIFQNFGSKAALYAAVIERAVAEVRDSLDELADEPGSARRLLAHVLSGPAHGEHAPSAPGATGAPGGGGHPGASFGALFADAASLAADPSLAAPVRDAVRAIAAHLADLIRHAQDQGGIDPGADPEAAAWLLLSVRSARALRAVAMPDGLEPAVTALVLGALEPR